MNPMDALWIDEPVGSGPDGGDAGEGASSPGADRVSWFLVIWWNELAGLFLAWGLRLGWRGPGWVSPVGFGLWASSSVG